MTRKVTSYRLPEMTLNQLKALTETTGSSDANVITIAIDRMYQQEIKTMTTELAPYDVALARVRADDDLYPHKDVLIDYDWDNEDEHYAWVATADKTEILGWVASFRDDIATQQERDELLDRTSKAIEQEHRKEFE